MLKYVDTYINRPIEQFWNNFYFVSICKWTKTISLQEISSPVNITSTDIDKGHYGLHLVRLHHIFDTDPENCIGNLNLTCKLGSHNYIVTEERLDFCKGMWKRIVGTFYKNFICLLPTLHILVLCQHFTPPNWHFQFDTSNMSNSQVNISQF